MDRSRWGRSLAVLVALTLGGCGGDAPSPIRLSLEVSDDSFCPGGRMPGSAEPERVEVRLGVRARGRAAVKLEGVPVDLKLYRKDAPAQVLSRQRIRLSMTVGETWRRPPEPIFQVPPEEEGRYVLEASTEDGAWSSTPLEVWFDDAACPRPEAPASPPEGTVVAAPSTTPSTGTGDGTSAARPGPTGTGDGAPRPLRTPLRAGLEARWSCNAEEGVEDLEVRVRVVNPTGSGRAVRGTRPRVVGVDELDPFERTSGELAQGYLQPGKAMEYQAFGWIEVGPRPVQVFLPAEPSPVATGTLQVDCSGGAGARGQGRLGVWE